MTATAISAVVARQPTTLTGWVTGMAPHVRPWVRLTVDFSDGTGSTALRFLGRTHVPGTVALLERDPESRRIEAATLRAGLQELFS